MFDQKKYMENQLLDRLTEGRFDPMAEVLPEGKQGVAQVDHFTMDPADMLASMAQHWEEYVPQGTYARLRVNGELMMTDSPMEKRTNLEVIDKATGRVLIAGLGIGMILRAIIKKPEVTQITVLEKYQDVVDLVLPSLVGYSVTGRNYHVAHVNDTILEVIVVDALQFRAMAETRGKYNVIYFDIWPKSNVMYLPEMNALHKRYRPLLARGGWMSSWTYKKLQKKQRDDERFLRQIPAQLERGWRDLSREDFTAAIYRMLAAGADELNDNDKAAIRKFAESKGIVLDTVVPRLI